MQPWEPFTVYTMAPSSPAHPLPSPAWELDSQGLTSLGTPAMQGSIWSTPVSSAEQPSPGLVGEVEVSLREQRQVEDQVYRGRSVLLCRVFLTVPSSRGRALCRLDMATVFLRSITA